MEYTIFFHAGMHKTSSSYIQTQIALNRQKLVKNKFFIPERDNFHAMESGMPVSGNGFTLFKLIRSNKISDAIGLIDSDIKGAQLASCNKILYSSENFFHLFWYNTSEWKVFERELSKKDIKTEGLIFVRNPVDHIISTFKHRIKDKYSDFSEWLNHEYETLSVIRNFLDSKNELHTNWILKNYSFHKKNITKAFFLGWLKIEIPENENSVIVNKSLHLSDIYLSHLVKPILLKRQYKRFRKALINIPDKQKADEKLILNKLRFNSHKFVFQNQDVFHDLNKLLPETEALEIPKERNIDTANQLIEIPITNKQIEFYFDFLEEIKSKRSVRQRLGIIKRELMNIYRYNIKA